jgi:cation:H+ antiporter
VALSIIGLAVLGAAIVFVGVRLASCADALAERTGLGQAFMGAVFLGATTSLPGITASVAAASSGRPDMALSNALGGIAVQTLFIVVADLAYRDSNLEHAAASESVLVQNALLLALLAMLLAACLGPEIHYGGVHPVTLLLPLAYALGLRSIRASHVDPMWQPRASGLVRVRRETRGSLGPAQTNAALWSQLAIAGTAAVLAGWGLTRVVQHLADGFQLSQSVAGGLITGVVTSFPELVIAVAAVRSGALTLAVAGVIGGNAFDTLFAALSDVAYRPGSIYHMASSQTLFLLTLALLMNAVLLLGLLRRQSRGLGNIGFEGVLVVALYTLGVVSLIME